MSIYTCFIQHVLNSLKPNGKAAIVLPTGFLTAKSSAEGKILKHIVEKHIVYGVISMPSNVFANTGTNVSVVFLDNSKQADEVILIDASKLGEEYQEGSIKKTRLTEKEISLIVDTFNSHKTIEDFSAAVSNEKLKEKNCSLAAGQHFDIKIEHIDITETEFQTRIDFYKRELCDKFKTNHNLEKRIFERLGELYVD